MMNHFLYKFLLLLVALVLLVQCNSDEGFPAAVYPRVVTLPVTDVGPDGATFHAKTLQAGTEEVLTRGFVWGKNAGVTLQNGENIETGPGSGNFDAAISFGLVKGETYFVKAFVKTKSMVAYAAFVEFISNGSTPPKITSFSPIEGVYGDTITIKGNRFSNIPGDNVVTFGSEKATVLKSTESSIICVVPKVVDVSTVPISVRVGDGQSQSTEQFSFLSPVIHSFSPATGTFGDIVTIVGENFNSSDFDNMVLFDTYVAPIVSVSPTKLVVKVPTAIRKHENLLTVTSAGFSTISALPFEIAAPVIANLSSAKAKVGDPLTITGTGFNKEPNATAVLFDGMPAIIQNVTGTSITVNIPDGKFDSRSIMPEVVVAGQSVLSPVAVELQDPWQRRTDGPGCCLGRREGASFVLNGLVYIGLGDESDQFWRYNPATNDWIEVASFPGGARKGVVSFVIGNYAYVGLSYESNRDFWRYSPSTNSWTRVTDFPVNSYSAVALSADDRGFVVIEAETNNFWEYVPAGNNWISKANYPGSPSQAYYPVTGFTLEKNLYVFSSDEDTSVPNKVYQYDTTSDNWSGVATMPNTMYSYGQRGFSVSGKGYIYSGSELLIYDPTTDNWTMETDVHRPDYGFFSLSGEVNGKVYFGAGEITYDWWEFDPLFK